MENVFSFWESERLKIFCKRLLYRIIGNCLVLPYMNQGTVYMINPEIVISVIKSHRIKNKFLTAGYMNIQVTSS